MKGEIKLEKELRLTVGLQLRLIFVVMGLSVLLCVLGYLCLQGLRATVLLGLKSILLHRNKMCLSASLL